MIRRDDEEDETAEIGSSVQKQVLLVAPSEYTEAMREKLPEHYVAVETVHSVQAALEYLVEHGGEVDAIIAHEDTAIREKSREATNRIDTICAHLESEDEPYLYHLKHVLHTVHEARGMVKQDMQCFVVSSVNSTPLQRSLVGRGHVDGFLGDDEDPGIWQKIVEHCERAPSPHISVVAYETKELKPTVVIEAGDLEEGEEPWRG